MPYDPVYHAQYYRDHKDEKLAYHRQHYQNCREDILARHVQYYQEHRAERVAFQSQWRKEHPDYGQQYNREHQSERSIKGKEWRRRHPGYGRVKFLQWCTNHPEWNRMHASRRRALLRGNGVCRVTPRDLQRLLVRYFFCCAYCGQPLDMTSKDKNPSVLHWDHVIPVSRGGRHSIGNLLPTCRTCNYSKHNKFLSEWRHGRSKGKLSA